MWLHAVRNLERFDAERASFRAWLFETYLFERDRAAFEQLVKSFQLPP